MWVVANGIRHAVVCQDGVGLRPMRQGEMPVMCVCIIDNEDYVAHDKVPYVIVDKCCLSECPFNLAECRKLNLRYDFSRLLAVSKRSNMSLHRCVLEKCGSARGFDADCSMEPPTTDGLAPIGKQWATVALTRNMSMMLFAALEAATTRLSGDR